MSEMTPALKAMVDAMAASLSEQTYGVGLEADGRTVDSGYEGMSFDLEMVARAGLGAIREPSEKAAYAGSWAVGPGGDRKKMDELAKAYRAMIDAILKHPT